MSGCINWSEVFRDFTYKPGEEGALIQAAVVVDAEACLDQ
jgi:hypothetical protein